MREFIKALLAKELSPKTVLNVMVILKEMLKRAAQWGCLDANPAQHAERPRGEDKEMEALTPPEIRRLLDAADEPVRTLVLCALLTGMRRGELLGLKWEDIDFEGNRIQVRRALWRGKFVTPKSRQSRRSIDLAPTLKATLARLPSRFTGELVFTTADGHAIDPDNFSNLDWARAPLRPRDCAGRPVAAQRSPGPADTADVTLDEVERIVQFLRSRRGIDCGASRAAHLESYPRPSKVLCERSLAVLKRYS